MVRRSDEAEQGGIVARLAASAGKAMLRNPILPILLVALPLFSIFVPFYATVPNLTNLMLAASVLLLLSIGGALTMISGNIDLSVEGTLAFTAMVAGWLMVARPAGAGLELNPLLAIVLSVGLGVSIGLLNALMVEALQVNSFIVTIGMLLALKGAAAIPTHATTIYGLPPEYSWVGLHSIFGLSWVAVIAFAICFALSFWLRNSVVGRHIYAIGGARWRQSKTASPHSRRSWSSTACPAALRPSLGGWTPRGSTARPLPPATASHSQFSPRSSSAAWRFPAAGATCGACSAG